MDGKNEILVLGQIYKIVRKIGEGAFSAVYLCRRESDEFHVAIKRAGIQESEISKAHDEMHLIDTIGVHKNIVRVLGSEVSSVKGNPSFTFAMEYCPGTVVDEMMDIQKRGGSFDSGASAGGSVFSSKKVLHIFSSVVSAIQHLHNMSPPITHRDIKPENVLRTEDGRYVLCDFGSCTTMAFHCRGRKDAATASNEIDHMTTLLYRAPEMLEPWKKKRIDQKTDVWALGIFLYYLMYFKFPFEETALSIINGKLTFPDTPTHPTELKEIVKLCLVADPSQRLTVFGLAQLMRATSQFGFSEDDLPLLEEVPGNEQCTPYDEEPQMAEHQATTKSSTDLFSVLDWSNAKNGKSSPAKPDPTISGVNQDLFASQGSAPSNPPVVSKKEQTAMTNLFEPAQVENTAPQDLFGNASTVSPRDHVDLFAGAWGTAGTPAPHQPQQARTAGAENVLDAILGGFSESKMSNALS